MKRVETNEDFMHGIMNYSPYGALCQVFVIEAIKTYCEDIIRRGKEHEGKPDTGMISRKAWVGIATDIDRRYKEFYQKKL